MRLRPFRSLATGITAVSLLVALIAIAVIAVGVLVVARSTFDQLMIQAGVPAAEAKTMFDHSVLWIFLAAVLLALIVSLVLAIFLAARLATPLRQMAVAARQIADGDYGARVPGGGPDEFASLADSFNQMAQSLADQERQRREFIVNAAHELRTPLTNLQGYLEALRDGVIAPSPEQFGSLHEEAERLVRLSRSLDALAENERTDRQNFSESIKLGQAVRLALEVARPAFEANGIRVEVMIPDGITVQAERDGLAQILANLLQNASRYTAQGGDASIRAESLRSQVLVSVTNTSDEIPAEDLPRVFERFYRVEKSRDAARGGAGIGLAIVKELVEASGGKVGVESADHVTRFWFTLPAG